MRMWKCPMQASGTESKVWNEEEPELNQGGGWVGSRQETPMALSWPAPGSPARKYG